MDSAPWCTLDGCPYFGLRRWRQRLLRRLGSSAGLHGCGNLKFMSSCASDQWNEAKTPYFLRLSTRCIWVATVSFQPHIKGPVRAVGKEDRWTQSVSMQQACSTPRHRGVWISVSMRFYNRSSCCDRYTVRTGYEVYGTVRVSTSRLPHWTKLVHSPFVIGWSTAWVRRENHIRYACPLEHL